jgi:hypothetical protein
MDGRIETNEPNTTIAAERFSNTPGASTILRDIGELKRVHQRLQLLAAVTSELIASDQPQQIIDGLCRKVMEHLDCQADRHERPSGGRRTSRGTDGRGTAGGARALNECAHRFFTATTPAPWGTTCRWRNQKGATVSLPTAQTFD